MYVCMKSADVALRQVREVIGRCFSLVIWRNHARPVSTSREGRGTGCRGPLRC